MASYAGAVKKSKASSSSSTTDAELFQKSSDEYFMEEDTEDEWKDSFKPEITKPTVREKMAKAAEERLHRNKSISSSPPSSPDMFEDSPELDQTPHNTDCQEEEGISWRGIPLNRLTRMSPTNPPPFNLCDTRDHTLLIKLPIDPTIGPEPSSTDYTDIWATDFVKMPCSPQSLYPQQKQLVDRWALIKAALNKPFRTVSELSSAIMSYNGRYASKWNFVGLRYLLEEEFEIDEQEHFFNELLPKMCKLALDLPNIVTDPIPLLTQDNHYSITMSQLQIASLLANAFFCTFPRRNAKGKNTEYENYPDINFNRLFFHKTLRSIEKLKCIVNYFRVIVTSKPKGVVSFTRQCIKNEDFPNWSSSSKSLPQLHVDCRGYIEDCQGLLQVDFANKYLGGGVLGLGCVQEEIRFVLCPELIVTRLFTEVLNRNEALIVTGVQQYNTSEGYAGTFKWTGTHDDQTPCDQWGRKICEIVAIDALHFSKNPAVQYQPNLVMREIQKAYAGYKSLSKKSGSVAAVATGNWGCGAFKGDPKLKTLLQLIACAEAGRDMVYFTFGDAKLRDELANIHTFLQDNNVTTGALVNTLQSYGRLRRDGKDLINYLHHFLSSYDSETETETPISSCDMETEIINIDKRPASERKDKKTNKTITDYFPSSSSVRPKTNHLKSSLAVEQISEALKKCDEVVATHSNKNKHVQQHESKSCKVQKQNRHVSGGSKLLQALDSIEKDPT